MASKKKTVVKKKPHYILFLIIVVAVLFALGIYFGRNITLPAPLTLAPTPLAPEQISSEKPIFKDTYKGVLPCADCSGLETELIFYRDQEYQSFGAFELRELYEGKSTDPLVTKGKWTLFHENDKNIYELSPVDGGDPSYYLQVNANEIKVLDANKNEIEAPFNETLKKQKNTQLANPAAVNCIDQGGKSEIRKDTSGNEYGVCLIGGAVCDEWTLYMESQCEEPKN